MGFVLPRYGAVESQMNMQAINSLVDTIGQIKQTRRDRQVRTGMARIVSELGITLQSSPPEQHTAIRDQARNKMMGLVTSQQQPQYSSGVSGFLEKIGNAVMGPSGPMTTPIESDILGSVSSDILQEPESPYGKLPGIYQQLTPDEQREASLSSTGQGKQQQVPQEELSHQDFQSEWLKIAKSNLPAKQKKMLSQNLMAKFGKVLKRKDETLSQFISRNKDYLIFDEPGEEKVTDGIAGKDDLTGLPEGTVYQREQSGQLKIIHKPDIKADLTREFHDPNTTKERREQIKKTGILGSGVNVNVTNVMPGDPIAVDKSTTSKIQDKMIGITATHDKLNFAMDNFSDKFLTHQGKVNYTIARTMDKFGAATQDQLKYIDEYTTWFKPVKQYFQEYKKSITGVAAGEKELQDIKESTINEDMSPQEFRSSITVLQEMGMKMYNRYYMLQIIGLDPTLEKNREKIQLSDVPLDKTEAGKVAMAEVEKTSKTGTIRTPEQEKRLRELKAKR